MEQIMSHIITKSHILNKSVIAFATIYLWGQIFAQTVTGIWWNAMNNTQNVQNTAPIW